MNSLPATSHVSGRSPLGNQGSGGSWFWAAPAAGAISLLCFCTATPASAQPRTYQNSKEIRRTAERILSSPEFRNLPPLELEEDDGAFSIPRPRVQSGSDSSDGQNGRGSRSSSSEIKQQDGANRQNGTNRSRHPRESDGSSDTKTPSGSRDEETSVTIPGGGLLAGAFGTLYAVLAWLMLVTVAGFIVFLIVKAFQNAETPLKPAELTGGTEPQGEGEPDRAPGGLPSDVYLSRARELAQAGDYRGAVSQLLLGAMGHVERSGLINFRRGLTYRDYLRAARRKEAIHRPLQALVRVYEPLGFGRRHAAVEHFEESLRHYSQLK